MKKINILLNGIIKENPTFAMLIGMCPTIAITTSMSNAIGMGLCVLFVLIFFMLLNETSLNIKSSSSNFISLMFSMVNSD